jgi:hypothetical protein
MSDCSVRAACALLKRVPQGEDTRNAAIYTFGAIPNGTQDKVLPERT